jgi:hypothetical protein
MILLADHLHPTPSARIEGELTDLRAARDGADKKAARAAEKRFTEVKKALEELKFIAAVEQCAEKGPPPPDAKTKRARGRRPLRARPRRRRDDQQRRAVAAAPRSGRTRRSGGRSWPTPTARRTTTGRTWRCATGRSASTASARRTPVARRRARLLLEVPPGRAWAVGAALAGRDRARFSHRGGALPR